MCSRSIRFLMVIALSTLAIAGCESNRVALPAEQPTDTPPRPTAPQAQAAAVPMAAEPASQPPQALAQTVETLEAIAQVPAHVFDRVAPAVVRVRRAPRSWRGPRPRSPAGAGDRHTSPGA
jgi:hypothetical protein